MAVERVKCTECDAMILPTTAAANAGLCGRCARVPAWLRRERREYEAALKSGRVFTPSSEERASARCPAELCDATAMWRPDPESRSGAGPTSAEELRRAAEKPSDALLLISARGARLNLSLNETYGVCEYHDKAAGEFRYAYTAQNLREQVAPEQHLIQSCPCCGVGMLWYPSRFHMPRGAALDLVAAVLDRIPTAAEWLNGGDISFTSRGKG